MLWPRKNREKRRSKRLKSNPNLRLKIYSYHPHKLINPVDPNQEEVAIEAAKVVLEAAKVALIVAKVVLEVAKV